jgi:hypothetical protein
VAGGPISMYCSGWWHVGDGWVAGAGRAHLLLFSLCLYTHSAAVFPLLFLGRRLVFSQSLFLKSVYLFENINLK